MDVSTFMQTVNKTISDLRYTGVTIDNDIAVHKIITELPQKFKIFVRSIQQETVMPTLENLGARLHLEESNMKLRVGNLSEEALVMRIRHVVRNNQARGRFSSFGSSSSSNSMQPGGHNNSSQTFTGRYDQPRGSGNR
jgi:hypothetical protein